MDKETRIKLFDEAMTKYVSVGFRKWLIDHGFFDAPASTKYHGNYPGGLFEHSYCVMRTLLSLSIYNRLKWQNERSPFLIGMFHDLCKIDQYINKDANTYEYNDEPFYSGHGVKSVLLLSEFTQLTAEEAACIVYHMGAFTDKQDWKYYINAVSTYENVLWTHTADMLASQVYKK